MDSEFAQDQPGVATGSRQGAVAKNQLGVAARREAIVKAARQEGALVAADLAERFVVSPETIRRDLRHLEQTGQIVRSYGTLRAVESGLFETGHQHRSTENREEKERIAAAAAQQIGDADTIFLDEGFLPSRIALILPNTRPLTVVTTSLHIAGALSGTPQHTTIMVGGRVRARTRGVVDMWAVQMLQSMQLDLAFIGATGITEQGHLTTPDPAVAQVKEAA